MSLIQTDRSGVRSGVVHILFQLSDMGRKRGPPKTLTPLADRAACEFDIWFQRQKLMSYLSNSLFFIKSNSLEDQKQ